MKYTIADVEGTGTVEEAVALRSELKARLTELDGEFQGKAFSDEAREEFATLEDLIEQTEARQGEFQMRRNRIAKLAQDQANTVSIGQDMAPRSQRSHLPEDLHDVTGYRTRTMGEPAAMTALMVDGAKKIVERATFPHPEAKQDESKARIFRLLDTIDDPAALARRIIGTGNPLYGKGFAKGLASDFRDMGSSDMRAAIEVQNETTAGGYAVPYVLDPTLILTSNGQANPLRQIARVESIMGNTWKGLTTAGISVARGTEAAAVDPDAVVFGQPSVTVDSIKAEIQFSIESDEDWPRLQSEMAMVIQDAKDYEESESFVNDTGAADHAEGVIYGLAATSDVGTTGDGLTIDDPGRLASRLPDRYEPNASWLGHRAVFSELDRLARAAGFNEPSIAAANQPTLLGYPRYYSSAMESDFVTAAGDILLFGDFKAGFLIVDRIGLSIEIDPHVRDGDGKWTGSRALLAHWRNSSLILVDNAFRLMKVGVVTS